MKKLMISMILVAFALALSSCSMPGGPEIEKIDAATDEYMVMGIGDKYKIKVDAASGTKATDLVVKDLYGNKVETINEKKGETIVIKAPSGGYQDGEIYSLDLQGKGKFADKKLKKAKSIMFFKKKDKVEYEHQANVTRLEGPEGVSVSDSTISLDGRYAEGDIILVDTNDDKIDEAYKLREVTAEGDKTTAKFDIPQYDEVYKKLDLFEYGVVDLSNIEVNEDAFIGQVEEAGILDYLAEEADAAPIEKDDIKCTFKRLRNGAYSFILNIDIHKNSQDGDDPNETTREKIGHITFTSTVKAKMASKAHIGIDDTVIGCSLALDFKNTVDSEIIIDESFDEEDIEKNINKLLEAYNKKKGKKGETTEFNTHLATIPIPIFQVVSSQLDFDFIFSNEINGNITSELLLTNTLNAGIFYSTKQGDLKKYASHNINDFKFGAQMTLDMATSASIQTTASILCVNKQALSANVIASAGPYTDLHGCGYVKYSLGDSKPELFGSYTLDGGILINVTGRITFAKKNFDRELYEKKINLLHLEQEYKNKEGSGSGDNQKTKKAEAKNKTASPEEINNALKVYRDLIRTTLASYPDSYADSASLYPDSKDVVLSDINNDGIPELLFFKISNEYGAKQLEIYTVENGKAKMVDYLYDNHAKNSSTYHFLMDNVSWGPRYVVFLDSENRLCIQSSQGGADSGEYRMTAWIFDDKCEVSESYHWMLGFDLVADGIDVTEGEAFDYADPVNGETDPKKCEELFQKQLRGIKKIIMYDGHENDYTLPGYPDDALEKATTESMTYDEFLDYVASELGEQ